MSGYPLVLEGTALKALVVGGGSVAERKVRRLLESGAFVRVVAMSIQPSLAKLAGDFERLEIERAQYVPSHLRDAQLVIAATDDSEVNARIAVDARELGRFVNVVDAPGAGNCVTPATHVAGGLVIAVSAAGVPVAARRIRDALAERFDGRYAEALDELARLRRSMLDAGANARWREAADALIGPDFCDRVERGDVAEGVARWR